MKLTPRYLSTVWISTGLAAAIVAAILLTRPVTPTTLRPLADSQPAERHSRDTISARLWQDPIEAGWRKMAQETAAHQYNTTANAAFLSLYLESRHDARQIRLLALLQTLRQETGHLPPSGSNTDKEVVNLRKFTDQSPESLHALTSYYAVTTIAGYVKHRLDEAFIGKEVPPRTQTDQSRIDHERWIQLIQRLERTARAFDSLPDSSSYDLLRAFHSELTKNLRRLGEEVGTQNRQPLADEQPRVDRRCRGEEKNKVRAPGDPTSRDSASQGGNKTSKASEALLDLYEVLDEALFPFAAPFALFTYLYPNVAQESVRNFMDYAPELIRTSHMETPNWSVFGLSGHQAGQNEPPNNLVIILPGREAAEIRERRLRSRYALQMAMRDTDFHPKNVDHLNFIPVLREGKFRFIVADDNLRLSFSPTVENDPPSSLFTPWIEEVFTKTSTEDSKTAHTDNQPTGDLKTAHTDTQPTGDSKTAHTDDQPTEWNVIWLTEQATQGTKDSGYSRLLNTLERCGKGGELYIINTRGSDVLREVRIEKRSNQDDTNTANRVWFTHATIPDNHLENEGSATNVARPIATDDVVLGKIADELMLRMPAHRKRAPSLNEILLIVEHDTVYSRTMEAVFREKWRNGKGGGLIQTFTYLQGIDGDLPSKDGGGGSAGQAGRPVHELLVAPLIDPRDSNRLFDRRQVDYIQRAAQELKDHQRTFGLNNRYFAIGVLGSDIYDKLMILQIFRKEFPDVHFFTTDLDALMIDNPDPASMRNLIVGGAFPINTRELTTAVGSTSSQASTTNSATGRNVAFREAYQTSLYNAAHWIVGNKDSTGCVDSAQLCIECFVLESRKMASVWEVGRSSFHKLEAEGQGETSRIPMAVVLLGLLYLFASLAILVIRFFGESLPSLWRKKHDQRMGILSSWIQKLIQWMQRLVQWAHRLVQGTQGMSSLWFWGCHIAVLLVLIGLMEMPLIATIFQTPGMPENKAILIRTFDVFLISVVLAGGLFLVFFDGVSLCGVKPRAGDRVGDGKQASSQASQHWPSLVFFGLPSRKSKGHRQAVLWSVLLVAYFVVLLIIVPTIIASVTWLVGRGEIVVTDVASVFGEAASRIIVGTLIAWAMYRLMVTNVFWDFVESVAKGFRERCGFLGYRKGELGLVLGGLFVLLAAASITLAGVSWFEGVDAAPSMVLRVFGILAAWYLILAVAIDIRRKRKKLSGEAGPLVPRWPSIVRRWFVRTIWVLIVLYLSFPLLQSMSDGYHSSFRGPFVIWINDILVHIIVASFAVLCGIALGCHRYGIDLLNDMSKNLETCLRDNGRVPENENKQEKEKQILDRCMFWLKDKSNGGCEETNRNWEGKHERCKYVIAYLSTISMSLVPVFVVFVIILVSRHPLFGPYNYPMALWVATGLILGALLWHAAVFHDRLGRVKTQVVELMNRERTNGRLPENVERCKLEWNSGKSGLFRGLLGHPVGQAVLLLGGGLGISALEGVFRAMGLLG